MSIWFALYYIAAVTVVVLHFTGYLKQRKLEWVIFVFALTIFPAMIYL